MTIHDILEKHRKLEKLDGGGFFKTGTYRVFGSKHHKYKFNSCLTETSVQKFEKNFGVTLPKEYRNFITQIGNGGSGPAYGLFQIADWNHDLEVVDHHFLATEFPHNDKWNVKPSFDNKQEDYTETGEYREWEDEYFSNKHITGSMRICHYGCAIYYLLVVTGKEAGHIWVDDRSSDYGIYPAESKLTGGRLTFIEWYDEWLKESLEKVS